jgi:glycosyltransferase involved in cell wall biosynthesis
VLVSAEDVGSIAAGIKQVVADEAVRARLRSAGPERARRFTWEQAARQVLACYQQVDPRA